jgi:inosine-uridine nucleoside N-ribohydrolase
MSAATVPVLLDTDIGTNIDDALCLAYLLREPRCELLGITTSGSEPVRRAALARGLCAAFGRPELPVWAGFPPPEQPFDRDLSPWQADLISSESVSDAQEPEAAVRFLAESICARPGRVTLITIGPLTNAARLFEDAPDVIAQLGAVVSMCGLFGEPLPGYGCVETNVGLDPAAAHTVFESQLSKHHILGLDVTGWHELLAQDFLELLPDGVPPLLRRLCEAWGERSTAIRFHDPMAGVSIFDPSAYAFVQARCSVQLSPRAHRGRTDAARGAGPHRLLSSIDFDRFLERFISALASV